MNVEGPPLEPLLHRLTDCPTEFLEVAGQDHPGGVEVVAIVCDLLRTLTPDNPPELEASHLAAIRQRTPAELSLISITCWLLSDPWFLGQPRLSPLMWKLLVSETLARLAGLVRPGQVCQRRRSPRGTGADVPGPVGIATRGRIGCTGRRSIDHAG